MAFRANHLYTNGPDIQGAFGVESLPLTIVAHVISYLQDDVASLGRLCRTSRVLFYMTLPHLWKSVTLKAYKTIRYRDDLPEGFGGASPFSMGLNALVTRNVSKLVRSLTLEGDLGVGDQDEYAKAGRVSESGMLLNIAVRAAIDQCIHLSTFRWDLDVRRQPNVYAGLAKLSNLESLWLKFPTIRSPQPLVEVPPLPNLKSLTFTHYDPLCFPDDLSNLFFHATRLESLNMHFSPRMRDEGEVSVVMTRSFRKNIAAKKKLRLKKIGIYNLLQYTDAAECLQALDSTVCEDFTSLNSFGPDEGAVANCPTTHFIDRGWMDPIDEKDRPKHPKSLRLDQLHKRHALDLAKSAGLERLYIINARYRPDTNGRAYPSPSSAEMSPGASCVARSGSRSGRSTPTPNTVLRDLYLDNICNVCGPTLKHLILPARWVLPTPVAARLIRSCPNLTQLSASLECTDHDMLSLLVPFLSKLWAIRVLVPITDFEGYERDYGAKGMKQPMPVNTVANLLDSQPCERAAQLLEQRLEAAVDDLLTLRYVGVGDKVWELGGIIEEVIRTPSDARGHDHAWMGSYDGLGVDSSSGILLDAWREEIVRRRRVKRITEEDVKDVEIWKLDSLDVV